MHSQQYPSSSYQPSYPSQSFTLQIRQFFRDYLQDISRTILKIKQNIYKLVNLQALKINHKVQIKPQLPSMYVHCKKTFDDLKRIDMLVEGLVKAKDIQLKGSGVTYKRRKRNSNEEQQQSRVKSRFIRTEESEKFVQSPSNNANFGEYSRINSITSPEYFKASRAKSNQNTYINQIKTKEYIKSPKYSEAYNKSSDHSNLDELKIIQAIKNQLLKIQLSS